MVMIQSLIRHHPSISLSDAHNLPPNAGPGTRRPHSRPITVARQGTAVVPTRMDDECAGRDADFGLASGGLEAGLRTCRGP